MAGEALSPDAAVGRALAENPELVAARSAVAVATARVEASGRLSNPELESELALGPVAAGRVEIGISQRFPLTARLQWERRLSRMQVELAALEVRVREWELAAAVRSQVVRLAAAEQALESLDRQLVLAEDLATTLRQQAGQGLVSSIDAGAAEIEGAERRLERDEARTALQEARGELAALLGRASAEGIAARLDLELPAAPPAAEGLGLRPDLDLAQRAVEAGEAAVSLSRAARWEDVGVGLFIEGERLPEDDGNFVNEGLLGVRFSIPLPLWNTGAAAVAESEATRDQRQARFLARQAAARSELNLAETRMRQTHLAASGVRRDLLPAARRHLQQTEAAYERGEVGIDRLFAARERLLAAERTALRASTAYHLAYFQWLHVKGRSLPPSKP